MSVERFGIVALRRQLSRDHFQKSETDLTSTASVQRRPDCVRCLLVRVKPACGSTEANDRI
jgi:hypothetical protein